MYPVRFLTRWSQDIANLQGNKSLRQKVTLPGLKKKIGHIPPKKEIPLGSLIDQTVFIKGIIEKYINRPFRREGRLGGRGENTADILQEQYKIIKTLSCKISSVMSPIQCEAKSGLTVP